MADQSAGPVQFVRLTADSKERKETPIYSGLLNYFPLACAAVARVSFKGNEKHNPGTELHWDRSKSTDQADCIARHLVEQGGVDEDGEFHEVHLAWRALALAELAEEKRLSGVVNNADCRCYVYTTVNNYWFCDADGKTIGWFSKYGRFAGPSKLSESAFISDPKGLRVDPIPFTPVVPQ